VEPPRSRLREILEGGQPMSLDHQSEVALLKKKNKVFKKPVLEIVRDYIIPRIDPIHTVCERRGWARRERKDGVPKKDIKFFYILCLPVTTPPQDISSSLQNFISSLSSKKIETIHFYVSHEPRVVTI